MKRRDKQFSKEEEKLLQEFYKKLGPVDRVYILYPFVKEKPPPKPPPPIRIRIRNFYADMRQKPAFLVLAAIWKGLYLIIALQLLLLLPLMINKCSVRPPLYSISTDCPEP